MSAERFTLDTNILVYSVDRTAGVRHRRAMTIGTPGGGRGMLAHSAGRLRILCCREPEARDGSGGRCPDRWILARRIPQRCRIRGCGTRRPRKRHGRPSFLLGCSACCDRRRGGLYSHSHRGPRGWQYDAWCADTESVHRYKSRAARLTSFGRGVTPGSKWFATLPATSAAPGTPPAVRSPYSHCSCCTQCPAPSSR